MVEVVFTQNFSPTPGQTILGQWSTPASGAIGMGTLTGTVGAVRTEQARKNDAAGTKKGRGWLVGALMTLVLGMALVGTV